MKKRPLSAKSIWGSYECGCRFKSSIGLYDTVKRNENYFIGKQWEGVDANGLPTPTFNFLKRVVLFQVATVTSDNMTIQASGLPSTGRRTAREMERITNIVNHQFQAIFERERFVAKIREFMRNAAVDGDGCMYFWFDPSIENGQEVKGEIRAEIVGNTRVLFGNPNSREVQTQPWIMIEKRMMTEDVQQMVEENGGNPDEIQPDSNMTDNEYYQYTNDKVTVLLYFYRDRETGRIWCAESTEKVMLREPYDTGYTLFPIIYMSWDYIQDCYHGQAMISGLVPNQDFVNKSFAMSGVSLMTSAFPKTVYDKNRIPFWSGAVGEAIGVPGNVEGVAKTIDPAPINPQIAQFLELSIDKTQTFLGASDVAMGDSRPDNTSAIIALQRAANTPMELTKQNMYQCVEDAGRIWIDMMRAKYGVRYVEDRMYIDQPGMQPLGMALPPQEFTAMFDFSAELENVNLSIKLDVGASSYWSEIASMQTIDNLLMQNKISLVEYLERVPQGYIAKKQELIDARNGQNAPPVSSGSGSAGAAGPIDAIPVEGGPGNGMLQRALNRTGVT